MSHGASRTEPVDDDAFLDLLYDRAVEARAEGAALDLDAALAGREHLRAQALRVVALAQEVAAVGNPANEPLVQLIPGYQLLREIGRGGMGIVYRAQQESLGRLVALKVLSPALVASPRLRERFALEARALGRLRHPQVVAVHDIVATEGVCAYAMEWGDGVLLASRIAVGKVGGAGLDLSGVARLGEQVARALQAVHAAGLVHRDVKPSNILLRAVGAPVLTDFGLVRDDAESMHTRTGEFLGTAAYAAPEQLRGAHDEVGPWTDVYGLGVTLTRRSPATRRLRRLARRSCCGASTKAPVCRSPSAIPRCRATSPPSSARRSKRIRSAATAARANWPTTSRTSCAC
jgi:serine/threonine protein kinase